MAIHFCVIAGFLVFTLVAAEPLFDRMERVAGEAQVHQFDLPAETGGMRSSIGTLETDGQKAVEIRGWAFIEDQDSENSDVYIVLESADRRHIFDTMVHMRPDVTEHFAETGLELDCSGFLALIPARRIADGEYTVGIYIRKGDAEALQYTDRTITKAGATIETG